MKKIFLAMTMLFLIGCGTTDESDNKPQITQPMQESIYSNEREESEQIIPTAFPIGNEKISLIPDAHEDEKVVNRKTTAHNVVDRVLSYILESEYSYGSLIMDGITLCEKNMGVIAGIELNGNKISVDDVGPGDIGVYGDNMCVCVANDDEGNAVFAYANAYASEYLPYGGVYLGYSFQQCDELFYGMYPVPCDAYYDCSDGDVEIESIIAKAEKYYSSCSEYVEELFAIGRMFSEKSAEEVKALVPNELMVEHNVKYEEGSMEKFLDKFVLCADAELFYEKDFSFVETERFTLSTGTYIEVTLINLSSEDFLTTAGRWEMTIGEKNIIPYPKFRLSDCVGLGFVRAKETVYLYDEEGNLIGYEYVDIVNKENTIVENEDGSRTYIGKGYSVQLGEDTVFISEDEPVIDLGNGVYLVRDKDGKYHTRDYKRYGDLPPEVLMQLIYLEMEKLNSETEQ